MTARTYPISDLPASWYQHAAHVTLLGDDDQPLLAGWLDTTYQREGRYELAVTLGTTCGLSVRARVSVLPDARVRGGLT